MNIGTIGIWTSYRPFGGDRAGEAARLAEQLGYGTWWVGGSPHVPDIRPVLEATSTPRRGDRHPERLDQRPGETAAADAALRAEFPGRFMLGIGIGHPEATSDYRRPLTAMRDVPRRPRRVTDPAAGRRALPGRARPEDARPRRRAHRGHAHRTSSPVEHTRFARERLGPGKLVAPELACVVDTDPVRAKAVAREYAKLYLGLRNYTQNLLDFGFTEDDLADGGSDRLIDAVDPPGSAEQIAEVVRAHLDAGADHVCLQPLGRGGHPARRRGRRSRAC